MTNKEVIEGLKELVLDRESFIKNETDKEDVFVQDKLVLEEAIKLIEEKSRRKSKKYHYFVSYAFTNGFGNCDVARNTKIESTEDIQELKKDIEKDIKKGRVIILNFIELKAGRKVKGEVEE